jgi:hypothetical protein
MMNEYAVDLFSSLYLARAARAGATGPDEAVEASDAVRILETRIFEMFSGWAAGVAAQVQRSHPGAFLADAIDGANVGLLVAIRTFDIGRGVDFEVFADRDVRLRAEAAI